MSKHNPVPVKRSEEESRSQRVIVSFRPSEIERIDQLADGLGRSRAEMAHRMAILGLEEAEKVGVGARGVLEDVIFGVAAAMGDEESKAIREAIRKLKASRRSRKLKGGDVCPA